MKAKLIQQISKDMTVGDVVAKYPQVTDTLTAYGLHCVGCHVNTMETLEQGCIGHGMPKVMFEEMMKKINDVITNNDFKGNDAIYLTDTAIKKVKELLKQEDKSFGLRFGVKTGGCSGFSYDLSFDSEKQDDNVIKLDGIKVFINKDHLDMLKGSKIDYIDGLQGAGFKISTPTAKSTCGCGHSFS